MRQKTGSLNMDSSTVGKKGWKLVFFLEYYCREKAMETGFLLRIFQPGAGILSG
jgi:hypothetical protein